MLSHLLYRTCHSSSRSFLKPCVTSSLSLFIHTPTSPSSDNASVIVNFNPFSCSSSSIYQNFPPKFEDVFVNNNHHYSNLKFVRGISTLSSSENKENGDKGELLKGKESTSWIDLYLPTQTCPYAHLVCGRPHKVKTSCKWSFDSISRALFSWFSIAFRSRDSSAAQQLQGGKGDVAPALRLLKFDDFIQSKAKTSRMNLEKLLTKQLSGHFLTCSPTGGVGPSVAFDASSMNEMRKWNEQYGEGGSRKHSPFGF